MHRLQPGFCYTKPLTVGTLCKGNPLLIRKSDKIKLLFDSQNSQSPLCYLMDGAKGLFIMSLTLTEERKLIVKIQQGDEAALKKLYYHHYPIVNKLMMTYYIESYDRQDWFQEGLIICYLTAKNFDITVKKRFGGYFRVNFQNWIYNIIRKNQRVKRQIQQNTYSFDFDWNTIKDDTNLIVRDESVMVEEWAPVIALLSDLELEELELALGVKEADKDYLADIGLHKRARYRMRQKFRQNLF